MANYSVLKAAVQAVIKTNGNQEITGANMQSTLISIINSLGTGYQFMGVATPSTSPGTPDYNVAYIGGAGTYANFGTSVTVPAGAICVFKYNGSWTSEQINIARSIIWGENVVEKIELTSTTNGYYLDYNGNISNAQSSSFNYVVFDVDGLNKVNVTGSISWGNPYYAFFSSSTTINSSTLVEMSELHPSSGTATEQTFNNIYVPSNAKVIVVNKFENLGCSVYKATIQILNHNPEYDATKEEVDNIIWGDYQVKTIQSDSSTVGYYLDSSGNTADAQSPYFSYYIFDVEDVKKVTITASIAYNNPYYGFFLSKTSINSLTLLQLSEIHSGSTATEKTFNEVEVPTGAKALVINQINDLGCSVSELIKEISNPNPKYDSMSDKLDKIEFSGTELQSLPIYQTITSKCLTSSKTINDAGSNTFSVIVYDVENIDLVTITASTAFSNPFYGFASGSNFATDIFSISDPNTSGSTPTQKTYDDVQVPTTAKYLLLNKYNDNQNYILSADAQVEKYILGNPIINELNTIKGKKWACVGDSLTAYNARTTKHYFDYVAEETGVIPLNYGVSGTGYARRREDNIAFYQRILDIDPTSDIVTIFGSFNDLGALSADFTMGSVDDTGTTTMAGCINTTITNVQSIIPLVRLGIVAPTPWDTTQPSTSGNAYNYVEMLKAICERRSIPFLDLWRHSNLHPWDAAFREVAYTRDEGSGTHPDENGHALIAPMFRQFILSLI